MLLPSPVVSFAPSSALSSVRFPVPSACRAVRLVQNVWPRTLPRPRYHALTRAIACRRMALRSSQAQNTCMTLGDSSRAQKVRRALLLLLVPVGLGLGFRLSAFGG
jgi:hypothetical protein